MVEKGKRDIVLMAYAKKVDANQAEIVKALREIGVHVFITSSLGKGFPDLVCDFYGTLLLVEIKDGSRILSQRKLTPREADFYVIWQNHTVIIESVSQALKIAQQYMERKWPNDFPML